MMISAGKKRGASDGPITGSAVATDQPNPAALQSQECIGANYIG